MSLKDWLQRADVSESFDSLLGLRSSASVSAPTTTAARLSFDSVVTSSASICILMRHVLV